MNVNNVDKNIIVSSALTGRVILTLDYNDYNSLLCARNLIADKMYQLLDNGEGVVIKIGYKG